MKQSLLTLLLLGIPSVAAAAEPLSTGSALLQVTWALLVVLGIILILYALAKKQFGLGMLRNGEIKVLEMRQLMPKTAIALVEVKGREMLLGIGTGGVQLLTTFPEEDGPQGQEPKNGHVKQPQDFQSYMRQEK